MVEDSARDGNSDLRESRQRSWARNPFFPMVLFSAFVFILTILAMVAVIFSDPRAPVAKFLEAHGSRLIAAEVAVTLIVGFFALVVDRIQARRIPQDGPGTSESEKEKPAERAEKS